MICSDRRLSKTGMRDAISHSKRLQEEAEKLVNTELKVLLQDSAARLLLLKYSTKLSSLAPHLEACNVQAKLGEQRVLYHRCTL